MLELEEDGVGELGTAPLEDDPLQEQSRNGIATAMNMAGSVGVRLILPPGGMQILNQVRCRICYLFLCSSLNISRLRANHI